MTYENFLKMYKMKRKLKKKKKVIESKRYIRLRGGGQKTKRFNESSLFRSSSFTFLFYFFHSYSLRFFSFL